MDNENKIEQNAKTQPTAATVLSSSPSPTAKAVLSEILTLIVGSAIYGLGIVLFLSPSGTIMGGATGIATTVNILFPMLSIGTMIFAVNVPRT